MQEIHIILKINHNSNVYNAPGKGFRTDISEYKMEVTIGTSDKFNTNTYILHT